MRALGASQQKLLGRAVAQAIERHVAYLSRTEKRWRSGSQESRSSTARRALACSRARSSCAGAMEAVAATRRELPPGGPVPTDYVFHGVGSDGTPTDVKLSELFAPGKDSLVLYSFMFPRDPGDKSPGPTTGQTAELPLAEGPCPSCVALIDQLHGAAEHVSRLVNLAVVAKAPLPRVLAFAAGRGFGSCPPRRTRTTATTTPRRRTAYSGRC